MQLIAGTLISLGQLESYFDVHGKTIRRWRKERGFPEPIVVGGLKRWRAEMVTRWIVLEEISGDRKGQEGTGRDRKGHLSASPICPLGAAKPKIRIIHAPWIRCFEWATNGDERGLLYTGATKMKFFKLTNKALHRLAASESIWSEEARRELERRAAARETVANHVRNGLLFRELAQDMAGPEMMTRRR